MSTSRIGATLRTCCASTSASSARRSSCASGPATSQTDRECPNESRTVGTACYDAGGPPGGPPVVHTQNTDQSNKRQVEETYQYAPVIHRWYRDGQTRWICLRRNPCSRPTHGR